MTCASSPSRAPGTGGRAVLRSRPVAEGLEIEVVDGDDGVDGEALVAAFRAGTLAPGDLHRLRFRLPPDDEWRQHPQVRFLHATIEPATRVDGPPLVWQQRVTGSPCGELEIWHRFDWGSKTESALGRHPAPDVTSTVGYDQVLAVMSGTFGPRGAAERGAEVEGDLAAMQRLLLVFDQPEFTAATRDAIGPLGPALRAIAPG